jgi:hypothetical protein
MPYSTISVSLEIEICLDNNSFIPDILPSGVLNPKAKNLIGSGCVIHVPGLLKELKDIESKGIKDARERLFISDRAQYVLLRYQVELLEFVLIFVVLFSISTRSWMGLKRHYLEEEKSGPLERALDHVIGTSNIGPSRNMLLPVYPA